jgi:hypothetical protein
MTAPLRLDEAHRRVVAHLTARLAGVTGEQAAKVLERGKITARSCVGLVRHFQEHPDALTKPGPTPPQNLVRLAHALVDAGHGPVTLPTCAGCGKTSRQLTHRLPAGHCCSACARRVRPPKTCSGCGRQMKINARGPNGPLCGTCYGKHVATASGQRGRVRRATFRMPDGNVRCQGCHPRPERTCVGCGTQAPVQAISADGYRQPQRRCGSCGEVRKIVRRGGDDTPDLCSRCYDAPPVTCSACGQLRPCARKVAGKPNLNGHRLPLPPEVAQLVRALRDQRQKSWHLDQTASTTPWLFPGQEPARPLGATYLYLKLRRHGIAPLASRNSARLALATDLPASVLADFTGTSISNSTRWTGYAKRDWLDYIASCKQR